MSEAEFRKKWRQDAPIFDAWAHLVVQEIRESVSTRIQPNSLDVFFKIDVRPRLKDEDSLVAKAFYREKRYVDPFNDITDKVGVRFVVLLESEIEIVEEALVSSNSWEFSKDKDFEDEWNSRPEAFAYQAVHYVVKPRAEVDSNGVKIPVSTTCEVQIKTLLQHAHSELTHDRLYKPKIEATPQMLRAAAKSMALIEATNDYFEAVSRHIEELVKAQRSLDHELANLYRAIIGEEPIATSFDSNVSAVFADEYKVRQDEIQQFFREHPEHVESIRNKRSEGLLWKQSTILLLYFFGLRRTNSLLAKFPYPPQMLSPILADLGINPDLHMK